MRRIVYFVLAFIVWVLLSWPFTSDGIDVQMIVAGLVTSIIAALMFHEMLPKEHNVVISPVKIFWFLVFIPVFLFYMIKANFDVVYRALHPKMPIKPGIVKIKTNLKTDSGITALANAITLTPGTMTVDLTKDGYLYIHWINVTTVDVEKATEIIAKTFEWFIKRIFE